jgi:hypothetical protein
MLTTVYTNLEGATARMLLAFTVVVGCNIFYALIAHFWHPLRDKDFVLAANMFYIVLFLFGVDHNEADGVSAVIWIAISALAILTIIIADKRVSLHLRKGDMEAQLNKDGQEKVV